jgi:hypothetical protein
MSDCKVSWLRESPIAEESLEAVASDTWVDDRDDVLAVDESESPHWLKDSAWLGSVDAVWYWVVDVVKWCFLYFSKRKADNSEKTYTKVYESVENKLS